MLTEAIACCAISAFGTLWFRERAVRRARQAEDDRTRELSLELALQLAERTPLQGDLRVPRRMSERILVLANRLALDTGEARSAALAAALPPGARADGRLPLPDGTRAALAARHARWDGAGVVSDLAGDAIPIAAQLLAAVDWMETRDGASVDALREALRYEAGRTFSPTLARVMAESLPALLSVASVGAHLGLRVTTGAMLCIKPCDPDALPAALRPAFLAALETRVRERLRPTDRVYCTEAEVVVWLNGTDADGAMRVTQRLGPVVERVVVPSIQRLEVACRIGAAVADSDATSFSDLLARARLRAQRAAAAA
jgi:hypothetical protein